MTTAFDLIIEGDLFGSMVQPFIDLLGVNGSLFLYGSLYIFVLSLTYIKTRDPMVFAIMFLISSGTMIVLVPPNLQIYFVVLFMASLALTLYQTFLPGNRYG